MTKKYLNRHTPLLNIEPEVEIIKMLATNLILNGNDIYKTLKNKNRIKHKYSGLLDLLYATLYIVSKASFRRNYDMVINNLNPFNIRIPLQKYDVYKLLKRVDKILKKNNIEYTVSCGIVPPQFPYEYESLWIDHFYYGAIDLITENINETQKILEERKVNSINVNNQYLHITVHNYKGTIKKKKSVESCIDLCEVNPNPFLVSLLSR